MLKKFIRFAASFETRNTMLFLLVCSAITLVLITEHLRNTEQFLLDNLSARLALIAEQSRDEFAPAQIRALSRRERPNSPEHLQAMQFVAGLEERYALTEVALLKRQPNHHFTYLADSKGAFDLKQQVVQHLAFPATAQAATTAWQAQKSSAVHLFESGESRWFQVYSPIRYRNQVVALLMITQFTSAIDSDIARRKQHFFLAALVAAMVLGVLFWALLRSQRKRQIEHIPTTQEPLWSTEPLRSTEYQDTVIQGEEGTRPLRLTLEHERTSLLQEAKMLGKEVEISIQEHGTVWIPDRAVARVQSVLHPLFENALHHGVGTNRPGEITIDIHPRNQGALVSIGDKGQGIHFERVRKIALTRNLLSNAEEGTPKRLLELLFDPGLHPDEAATQDKDAQPHYTSGLVAVKKKLEDIGGKLKLVSTANVGTTAYVFLPQRIFS